MKDHIVRTYRSSETLTREDQLAWKIAAVAADPVAIEPAVRDMAINRIIDNASVAIAAINRAPPACARAQAIAHPRRGGATVFRGPRDRRGEAAWEARANGDAGRELGGECAEGARFALRGADRLARGVRDWAGGLSRRTDGPPLVFGGHATITGQDWRDFATSVEIDPARVRKPEDLGDIFTLPEDLLRYPAEDFLCRTPQAVFETTGTSGGPKRVGFSYEELDHSARYEAAALYETGLRPGALLSRRDRRGRKAGGIQGPFTAPGRHAKPITPEHDQLLAYKEQGNHQRRPIRILRWSAQSHVNYMPWNYQPINAQQCEAAQRRDCVN